MCIFVVGGADYRIFFVSCRWPGSVADARVVRNSVLWDSLENGWRPFPGAVILGDSAYPLRQWLMTPLPNPDDANQRKYNDAHAKTRRIIEQVFGIMKARFPILDYMRVQPEFAARLTKCMCILHNMALTAGEDVRDFLRALPAPRNRHHQEEADLAGRQRRQELVEYFSQRRV